ncbi:MAG: SoxXA-binding protein [Gammaproteobacteria bacterium]|nr:SoxXA-binding protein [Gammaproteobacteria bacterium]
MKKFIPFAVAAGLALGGCASSGGMSGESSAMATEAQATAAIAAAQNELKMATAANNVWRDTGKDLEKAEKAAKEGKYDEAVKLANAAKDQAALAVQQAAEQKDAGPRY